MNDSNRQVAGWRKLRMSRTLATQVVIFIILLAMCLLIRWRAPEGAWPAPRDVHLVVWIGIVNTLVLICSSATIAMAYAEFRINGKIVTKNWILVAVILGGVFLGIRLFETKAMFENGIYPAYAHGLLHNRADLYYAAAVRHKLNKHVLALDQKAKAGESIGELSENQQRQTICSNLLEHFARPAETKAAKTDSPAPLETLAYAINHSRQVEAQDRLLQTLRDEWETKRSSARQQVEQTQRALPRLQKESEKLETAKREADGTKPTSADQLDIQIAEIDEQISQVDAQLKTALNTEKMADGRLTTLSYVQEATQQHGLNTAHPWLRLPMWVPNAQAWFGIYLLLTGFHTFHLLVGLVSLVGLYRGRGEAKQAEEVGNTSQYWHFVSVMWIILFLLLYLF